MKKAAKRRHVHMPAVGDVADKRCAFAVSHGCASIVDKHDWCSWCRLYVCEKCDWMRLAGPHYVTEHRSAPR